MVADRHLTLLGTATAFALIAERNTDMKPTTRINLEVSHELKQTLTEVKTKTGATTLVEVFKRAIALYSLIHQEYQEGSKLIIHKKDGTTETIIIL